MTPLAPVSILRVYHTALLYFCPYPHSVGITGINVGLCIFTHSHCFGFFLFIKDTRVTVSCLGAAKNSALHIISYQHSELYTDILYCTWLPMSTSYSKQYFLRVSGRDHDTFRSPFSITAVMFLGGDGTSVAHRRLVKN